MRFFWLYIVGIKCSKIHCILSAVENNRASICVYVEWVGVWGKKKSSYLRLVARDVFVM